MTLSARVKAVLRSKTYRAPEPVEDPRQALETSYERQLSLLQDVRRGLAEISTAKKRIELQVAEIGVRYDRLGVQAYDAVTQERDDLARIALTRRAAVESQVKMLQEQHAALATQEAQLIANQQRLAERIETFRIQKEAFTATYAASEAQARANEAIAGLGGTMVEAAQTLRHAEERVMQVRARALATEELLATGALSDFSGASDAELDRQITEVARAAIVDKQLAAMKQDVLASGAGP
ncbi:MAG: PspA/IM30 family protein [Thermomicrobiales bacterium]